MRSARRMAGGGAIPVLRAHGPRYGRIRPRARYRIPSRSCGASPTGRKRGRARRACSARRASTRGRGRPTGTCVACSSAGRRATSPMPGNLIHLQKTDDPAIADIGRYEGPVGDGPAGNGWRSDRGPYHACGWTLDGVVEERSPRDAYDAVCEKNQTTTVSSAASSPDTGDWISASAWRWAAACASPTRATSNPAPAPSNGIMRTAMTARIWATSPKSTSRGCPIRTWSSAAAPASRRAVSCSPIAGSSPSSR